MTNDKIKQIMVLINQQEKYIIDLKGQFEIALGEGFLDNSKLSIYDHISRMDDALNAIQYVNGEMALYGKEK